jgi:predicted RecA/RadA family phage recombinase
MKNSIQCGDSLEFTAPAGGVISGAAVLINSLLVVAEFSAAAGERFIGEVAGVFALPKAAGAWTEGQLLYFDSAANNIVTAPSATARRVGCAAAAALAADTIGLVRLHGVPAPANVA